MNVQVGRDITESKKKLASGTYLRNAWYAAAWSDELGDGGVVGRTIMKEPVVVYREGNGDVAALEDRCPHRFAPLSMGKVLGGNRIQCPYHGLEFDRSGRLRAQPARQQAHSEPGAGEELSGHREAQGGLGLDGRQGAPIQSKVPDFSVMDNVPELHTTKRDSIMIKANVELIIDNLLDLSHTSFLHEGILGNADTVESEIMVEQEGDDVTVKRHARDAEPPGMNRLMWPQSPQRVDKSTNIRWMAPSTLRLMTGICQIGATPRLAPAIMPCIS